MFKQTLEQDFISVIKNVLEGNSTNISHDGALICKDLHNFTYFGKLYLVFLNDGYGKLKSFLTHYKNLDKDLTKILVDNQEDFNYSNDRSEIDYIKNFVVSGGSSESLMTEAQVLVKLINEDLSVFSLLGNDSYDNTKDFSNILSAIDIKKIPQDFKESLVDALFSHDGALEWSVDGSSREISVKSLLPLYESSQVLAIYKGIVKNKKKAKWIAINVECVVNSITESTIHPEEIFSLDNQKFLLNALDKIIKDFDIKIEEQSIWDAEYFNYQRISEEMDIPILSEKIRKGIQENIDKFKTNISSHLIK